MSSGAEANSAAGDARRRSGWIFSDDVSPIVTGQIPERVGEFTLESVIGDGAMGIVFAACSDDGAAVAVKVLRPELLGSIPEVRFRREMEILRRLDHPGLCRIIDSGVVAAPIGDLPWIAMERIEGPDLITDAEARALDLEQRLDLLQAVAEAMGSAHVLGFVHRDLKPDNIRVDPDGRPRVLDFGIAAVLTEIADGSWYGLTQTDELLGSFDTLSPEQVLGAPLGPPSDVYALAVIGGTLLTGRSPYTADSDALAELLQEIGDGAPGDLHSWEPLIPAPIFAVLRRALSPDPTDRPENGTAFARALADARGS